MTSSVQLARWMGTANVAGGALWMVGFLLQGEWGPLGTPAYETYQTINRLSPIPLLLMAIGLVGVYKVQAAQTGQLGKLGLAVAIIGLTVMLTGSVAEFWFFTKLPYEESNLRDVAWGTFLLGALTLMVGSALLGIATWRAGILPDWSALLLIFAMPLGVASVILGIHLLSNKAELLTHRQDERQPSASN